jgi:formylmethanofuran dehydrogenase subunit E
MASPELPFPALQFEALLKDAQIAHGHLCAGQILGVRMAILALQRLGIEDPRGIYSPKDRKRLVTFVEIDRCATDAIGVVTGCRLGKRALKVRDWGKMAATFLDLASPILASPILGSPILGSPILGSPIEDALTPTYKAIRIAALESSKARARERYPHIEDKNQQQMLAYRELPDSDLFSEQWVQVPLHPREMPGYKSPRIACAQCGEGINYDRETTLNGKTLCQSCAHPESNYYQSMQTS